MSEKMIINANLIRKESEFRTKSCVVEKAIAVSHAEFDDLKRYPLRDNKLIAENADLMYCDIDDNYHCLLIYDEEQSDGLLIESEGTLYARYAQYIPRAKELVERHKWVALIYVTSYGEYITKAMTIHPFSYITKPFQPEQISKVLEEFVEYQRSVNARTKEYFQLNTNNSCRYLEMDDIYYFYYLEDRTVEVKLRKEKYKIKDSITNIYNIVNRRYFIMPTPSIIVNIQHINKIDVKNKKLILENDEEILISRRKYKEVFDALNRYMTNGEL